LPANGVGLVRIDSEGNKWMLSDGLVKFDGKDWTVYNTSNSGLPANGVTLSLDDADNKWIGTSKGLVKFDGKDWTVYTTSNSGMPFYKNSNNVDAIAIDRAGNKWIGNSDGNLAVFNEGGIVSIKEKKKKSTQKAGCGIFLSRGYPLTRISWSIEKPGAVVLSVFDIKGKIIKTLVMEYKKEGCYHTDLNCTGLPSGAYFISLQARSNRKVIKKMILTK
jgi:hypothetical protein